jgi:hypothetical protein
MGALGGGKAASVGGAAAWLRAPDEASWGVCRLRVPGNDAAPVFVGLPLFIDALEGTSRRLPTW